MGRALSSLLPGGCLLLMALGMAGCGTSHPLPPYETPIAHTRVQSVRTTAYTHTEADHVEYGDHNALGGTLHAAARSAPPPTEIFHPPAALAATDVRQGDFGEGGFRPAGSIRPVANVIVPVAVEPPSYAPVIPTVGVGSAAADWSRWPAGTVFRVAATGQVYQVDDYGWALAGRNTIDLYQSTRGAMNAWGVRRVDIEILRWGDPEESLRLLRRHQGYRHIHRMVLELEGRQREAAALE